MRGIVFVFKEVRRGQRVAEEGFLQGAPSVGYADDDADACGDRPPGLGDPRADENLKFGDEAGEAGQTHGGHSSDDEGPRGKRQTLGQMHGFEFG